MYVCVCLRFCCCCCCCCFPPLIYTVSEFLLVKLCVPIHCTVLLNMRSIMCPKNYTVLYTRYFIYDIYVYICVPIFPTFVFFVLRTKKKNYMLDALYKHTHFASCVFKI